MPVMPLTLNSNLILLIPLPVLRPVPALRTLNSNLILLIPFRPQLPRRITNSFKFQSDSINTGFADGLYTDAGTSFKFQSDSINTGAGAEAKSSFVMPLNSNLILLIRDNLKKVKAVLEALNSNLILLIQCPRLCMTFSWLSLNSNLILLILKFLF